MADLNVLLNLMDINYHYLYDRVFLMSINHTPMLMISPAEWNPDIHDNTRTPDEMIRQFSAVPHDAVNKFYDLKGNVNLDYLRSANTADIAAEQ
jgi:hypothetical protein